MPEPYFGSPEQFWAAVQRTDTCWLWTGPTNERGYGRARIMGTIRRAHRVSWEMSFGEIPRGLCVLHRCDVPACVRPDHLWLGTLRDNNLDKVSKGRQARGQTHGSRTQPTRGRRRFATHVVKSPLSHAEIAEIRRLYQVGDTSHAKLALAFSISTTQAGRIVNGFDWVTPQE